MTPVQQDVPRLGLSETELSRSIKLSVSFLQHDRCGARRIPFYRIGRVVRYDLARVREALSTMEEGGPRTPSKRRGGAAA